MNTARTTCPVTERDAPQYPYGWESVYDLATVYDEFRSAGPVARITLPGGGAVFLVTRYDEANGVPP